MPFSVNGAGLGTKLYSNSAPLAHNNAKYAALRLRENCLHTLQQSVEQTEVFT